jgi:hypothetical protein
MHSLGKRADLMRVSGVRISPSPSGASVALLALALTLGSGGASAGTTLSVKGSVVNDRGKAVSGAYVFMCDARNGVKLRRGLVVAGPGDPVCGAGLYSDAHTSANGAFALVSRPAPYVIVAVQDGRYSAEECAYRGLPDAELRLKFVLFEPRRGRGPEEEPQLRSCPAASRPELGFPQDTYILQSR